MMNFDNQDWEWGGTGRGRGWKGLSGCPRRRLSREREPAARRRGATGARPPFRRRTTLCSSSTC